MIDTGNANHPVLTPVELPTRHVTRAVSVEQNFNHFRVADNLVVSPVNGVVVVVGRVRLKESKSCAISISECDGITARLTLKISETDPDGIVLGNLDSLEDVEVVEISARKVRRCQDTICW